MQEGMKRRTALQMFVRWTFGLAFAGLGSRTAFNAEAGQAPRREKLRTMLNSVKHWGCQYQNVHLPEIEDSDLDMVVLDMTLDGTPGRLATPAELARLKRKPNGNRRIVLAYLSVGEAADYRPYWRQDWRMRPPDWLGPENPNWQHAFPVRFWAAQWEAILLGRPDAMLDRILAADFDGVFLDRIDVFAEWLGERPTAPQDMVALVGRIADYAHARNQDFIIMGQNAEQLLINEAYRAALDGVSKESLLFGLRGEGVENTPEQIAWSMPLLNAAVAAALPVFAIEYLSDPNQIAAARQRLFQLGFIPFFGHRLLDRLPT